MLDRLKRLLAGQTSGTGPGSGSRHHTPPEVAVTALLLECADADDTRHLLENATLAHGLQRQFGLDAAGVEAVLAQADRARRDSVSLHDFTHVVLEEYSEPQRIAVVELIWHVILADGELTADETILARRLGNLLDLQPEDVSGAIRRARGK